MDKYDIREIIAAMAIKYNGDNYAVHQAFGRKQTLTDEEMKKVSRLSYVTILDKEYPEWLKHVSSPPYVMFYYGKIESILNEEECLYRYNFTMVSEILNPRIIACESYEYLTNVLMPYFKDIIDKECVL